MAVIEGGEEEKKAPATGEEGTETETETETGTEEKPMTATEAKELRASLKKANDEAKTRRLENKKLLEEKKDRDEKIEALNGAAKKEPDPVKTLQVANDLKLSRSLLRGAIAAEAKDAHDPAALLQAYPAAFKDIEVDLENESVDSDQLTEAVEKLRKNKPFLFQGAKQEEAPLRSVRLPPDGAGGAPKAKPGSERATWNKLVAAGDVLGAQQFYAKNKAMILKQMQND